MNHRHSLKFGAILSLACALAVPAFGQYPGGTTGTAGAAGSSAPSYGNKGAAIGAVAGAGAGAVAILLLVRHHRHSAATLVGCVGEDGKTFRTDKGNHSFAIVGDPLTPGEHLAVTGKQSKNASSERELEMLAVQKDLGQCQPSASASARGSGTK